jgi:hypothetical protein
MYQDLNFEDHGARQIRRMLLLLIARPDLANRIRSVSFAPKDQWTSTSNIAPASWAELQDSLEPIQAAMNNALVSSSDNAMQSMQWFSGVLSSAEDSDRRCAVATFSLIASMAIDLQSISFELVSSELGGRLCQVMNLARPGLFSKLRFLKFDTKAELSVKIILSLEVLDITGSWQLNMRLTGEQRPHYLDTLRISDASFRFTEISAFCRDGKFPFLKELALNECKMTSFSKNVHEELEEPITALRDKCPRLVHFEALRWNYYHFQPFELVLPDLDQLTSLRKLVIDGGLLVDQSDWMSIFDTSSLPPNITSLTLGDINIARLIRNGWDSLGDLTGQAQPPFEDLGARAARERAIRCFVDLVSATRVKTLTVVDDRTWDLSPGSKYVLKELSARLQAEAVVAFRVRDNDGDDVLVDPPVVHRCPGHQFSIVSGS